MTKDDGDKVEQADSLASESMRARSSLMFNDALNSAAISSFKLGDGNKRLSCWGSLDISCPNCPQVYPAKIVVWAGNPLSRRAYCVDCGTAVDIEITVRPSKESADG